MAKKLIILAASLLVIFFGFQNCGNPATFQKVESSSAEPEQSTNCVSNRGDLCVSGRTRTMIGCEAGDYCAAFSGVWTNNPPGCSPTSGRGGDPNNTSLPSWETRSGPHCVNQIGAPQYPMFFPDGQCHHVNTPGIYPNTYTRVVLHSNSNDCVYQQDIPGIVQCNGSCR